MLEHFLWKPLTKITLKLAQYSLGFLGDVGDVCLPGQIRRQSEAKIWILRHHVQLAISKKILSKDVVTTKREAHDMALNSVELHLPFHRPLLETIQVLLEHVTVDRSIHEAVVGEEA